MQSPKATRALLSLLAGAVAMACIALSPVYAQQPPPLPHAFYGEVWIDGAPAPAGTVVEARGQGVRTGIAGNPISVTTAGRYGGPSAFDEKLVVQGDIAAGTPIGFFINGVRAECAEPGGAWGSSYPYQAGGITALNLRVGAAGGTPLPATPTPAAASPTPTALSPTGTSTSAALSPTGTSTPAASGGTQTPAPTTVTGSAAQTAVPTPSSTPVEGAPATLPATSTPTSVLPAGTPAPSSSVTRTMLPAIGAGGGETPAATSVAENLPPTAPAGEEAGAPAETWYTPESVEQASSSSGGSSIWIWIGILVLVVLIGVGGYYIVQSQKR